MNFNAALYLESGSVHLGRGLGARVARGGEVVFNTGMTGYQEILTDPSYSHQIVVMSASQIGNTGTNPTDFESDRVYLQGFVIREESPIVSNWRATEALGDYLERFGVFGISGLDTRAVTHKLRAEGAQRGVIFPCDTVDASALKKQGSELLKDVPPMDGLELVSEVSCREPYTFQERGLTSEPRRDRQVVVYDFGVKRNILRSFYSKGLDVFVVPHDFPSEDVLALKPAAVALSNGPGDPAKVNAQNIERLIGKIPIFAVCMGHQVLARALGASTYKLKFGHHGINHPVRDESTKRVLITSHNHGFAVSPQFGTKDVVVSHLSLNDQTVEGFRSERLRLTSVQFHPEAKPGPNDANYLFEEFVRGHIK